MKVRDSIDWNEMSQLGLIERINREILHPLGLAISRDPMTGVSNKVVVSGDGLLEYPDTMVSTVLTDEEIKACLKLMAGVQYED